MENIREKSSTKTASESKLLYAIDTYIPRSRLNKKMICSKIFLFIRYKTNKNHEAKTCFPVIRNTSVIYGTKTDFETAITLQFINRKCLRLINVLCANNL